MSLHNNLRTKLKLLACDISFLNAMHKHVVMHAMADFET